MKRRNAIATLIISLLVLAGCQANGPKETRGTILGAAGGGLLGSQVGSGSGQLLGIAVGTLAGAVLGADIGRSLDNADRAMARWNEEAVSSSALTTAGTQQIGKEEVVLNMIGTQNGEGSDYTAAQRSTLLAHNEAIGRSYCTAGPGFRPVVD